MARLSVMTAALVAHCALFTSIGLMWSGLHYQAPVAPAPSPNETANETWTCSVCQHIYDPAKDGNGLPFEQLPDTWKCPVCGHPKSVYRNTSVGSWVHDEHGEEPLGAAKAPAPPGKFAFGQFNLHPLLMSVAFIVWGPLGGMTYSVYEGLLGLSHVRAKALHASVQLLGLCFAVAGVLSMRETHAGLSHMQTLHSWIGIFVLFAYSLQWLVSFPVFYFAAGTTRAALLPYHIVVGLLVTVSSIFTVITGITKLSVGSPDIEAMRINASGVCVFVAMLAMGYVIYSRHRVKKASSTATPADSNQDALMGAF